MGQITPSSVNAVGKATGQGIEVFPEGLDRSTAFLASTDSTSSYENLCLGDPWTGICLSIQLTYFT